MQDCRNAINANNGELRGGMEMWNFIDKG